MRPLVQAVLVSMLLGGAFGLGRLTADRRVIVDGPRDEAPALGRDLADLKAQMVDLRRAVVGLGARLAVAPPAAGANAPVISPACPPAALAVEEDAKPEDAAHLARARGDQRFHEGEALVSAAVARGTWTSKEVEDFRSLQRGGGAGPEWIFLMQQVDAAINAGKLRPDPELTTWH